MNEKFYLGTSMPTGRDQDRTCSKKVILQLNKKKKKK